MRTKKDRGGREGPAKNSSHHRAGLILAFNVKYLALAGIFFKNNLIEIGRGDGAGVIKGFLAYKQNNLQYSVSIIPPVPRIALRPRMSHVFFQKIERKSTDKSGS